MDELVLAALTKQLKLAEIELNKAHEKYSEVLEKIIELGNSADALTTEPKGVATLSPAQSAIEHHMTLKAKPADCVHKLK